MSWWPRRLGLRTKSLLRRQLRGTAVGTCGFVNSFFFCYFCCSMLLITVLRSFLTIVNLTNGDVSQVVFNLKPGSPFPPKLVAAKVCRAFPLRPVFTQIRSFAIQSPLLTCWTSFSGTFLSYQRQFCPPRFTCTFSPTLSILRPRP